VVALLSLLCACVNVYVCGFLCVLYKNFYTNSGASVVVGCLACRVAAAVNPQRELWQGAMSNASANPGPSEPSSYIAAASLVSCACACVFVCVCVRLRSYLGAARRRASEYKLLHCKNWIEASTGKAIYISVDTTYADSRFA
jgi:hypothetical protein